MTVYVAAAFGSLELIDIISGPLGLPDWAIKAVMILAVICFPITFLLSWFFPKSAGSPTHLGFLLSDVKAELDFQDIELQPDELLPYQFSNSDVSAKKSPGRLQGLILGVISFMVIVAAVVLFLFYGGKSVPFKERDWIVITDFENQTNEEIFDKSLNTAFALSINQSRHINVLSRERMQETLRLMKVEDLENIDEKTGKEIAIREGVNFYMVPSISRVGSQYILTVRIQDAVSGNTLNSEVVYAEGQDEILGKLDVLIKKIRHSLGESRYQISGQDKPLAKVTTSSLDALREYSLGRYYKLWLDFEQANVHYENAIRIDSGFTIAKVALGTSLYESFDKDKGRKWLEEAMGTIDDLTDYEKYNVLVNYALYVENNLNKGIDYAKARINLYPDSPELHHNLGFYYQQLGKYDNAVAEYKKSLRIDPNLTMAYANLIWTYLHNLGQMDSALIWSQKMIEHRPDHSWGYCYMGSAYVGKGNLKEAEYAFSKARDLEPTAVWGLFRLAYVYRLQGKYDKAIELLKEIFTQHPEEIDALYDLGVIYNRIGDQNNARDHFLDYKDSCENWVETNPDDPLSYLYCGMVYARLGNREAGWAMGVEAMKIDSKDYFAFAEFYAVQDSIEKALDQLEKAFQNGYRDLPWLQLKSNFDALRDEIRYQELIYEYFKSD
jgi:tetratricopeptide (TPR) repeat protein